MLIWPATDQGAQTYKPENALKRAEELIAQEQPTRALNALHDVISNRKYVPNNVERTLQAFVRVAVNYCEFCRLLRTPIMFYFLGIEFGKHAWKILCSSTSSCASTWGKGNTPGMGWSNIVQFVNKYAFLPRK